MDLVTSYVAGIKAMMMDFCFMNIINENITFIIIRKVFVTNISKYIK